MGGNRRGEGTYSKSWRDISADPEGGGGGNTTWLYAGGDSLNTAGDRYGCTLVDLDQCHYLQPLSRVVEPPPHPCVTCAAKDDLSQNAGRLSHSAEGARMRRRTIEEKG